MAAGETKVAIIMGSDSDRDAMSDCKKYLDYFGIPCQEFVLSAHRTPDVTAEFARNAEKNGYRVLIGAAGMAAHLAGALAAHTVLPVIGVPLPGSHLNGVDALYSTVQMPRGVPVATVAIGPAGAVNAAVLAAQIIALTEPAVKKKLIEFKGKGSRL
ncbi:MAG: 5-(carboxyamino)imidazole ribonucleotide mutase [bacterium]